MVDEPQPKKWRQLLFPWAEEERLAKEAAEALAKKAKNRRDGWLALGFIGAIGAIMMVMGKVADAFEKRGKMLQEEWRLKYDDRGNPRPEYWQGRTITEQAEDASWVRYLKERGETHGKTRS